MSIEAQMEDIARQSRDATAELEAMLENQPAPIDTLPDPAKTHRLFSWGIALAAAAGLMVGLAIREFIY